MAPPTTPIHKLPTNETPNNPDAPMTSDQAVEMRALCDELDEEFDDALTQEQAEERLKYLRDKKNDS